MGMSKGGLTPSRRAGMGLVTIEGVGYDAKDPLRFYAGGRAGRKLGQADVMLETIARGGTPGAAPPAGEAPAQTFFGLTGAQVVLVGVAVWFLFFRK